MKPAKFDYLRPTSPAEAIEALTSRPDAKVLAGGQSLIPMMNMRLATPGTLVDVGGIDELAGITANGNLRIGATTRQVDVLEHDAVRRGWPVIAAALRHVGHPQTRERGTFGGSIAHGEPGAELPAVMLALDATVTVQGSGGVRTIPADEFFLGHYTTALAEDDLLVSVEIPDLAGARWGFSEVVRRHGDYALAGATARLRAGDDGTVTDARIALFAVADRAVRAVEAEQALVGTALGDEAAAGEAARLARSRIEASDDSFVSATYRKEATAVVVRRSVLEASTNPKGEL